jgi:hypothetical protein
MIRRRVRTQASSVEGRHLVAPTSESSPDLLAAVVAAVDAGAPTWFSEIAGAQHRVAPAPATRRARARLHRIDVTWPGGRRSVVAKATSLASAQTAWADRPRLGTVSDYRERHTLEYVALSAVHDHVARHGDPRLASVRPLIHLPQHRAFVMEHLAGTTLRAWTSPRAGWSVSRRTDVAELYLRAGLWLRAFHAAVPVPAARRRADAAQFSDGLQAYLTYLEPQQRASTGLERLATAAAAAFSDAGVPDLVAGHGDCAPRNFLVTDGRRLAGYDVLGKWAVPREEDLAYFLLSLRLLAPQVVSLGQAYPTRALAQWEQAFLDGYGSELIVEPRLHAYGVLVLLDRWAATLERSAGGLRGRVQPAVRRLLHAALRRQAARLTRVLQ